VVLDFKILHFSQPKTFLDYRPNFLQPPIPKKNKQKKTAILGGMFFQVFFLTNRNKEETISQNEKQNAVLEGPTFSILR
jgi:hypothetical protein